jgi:phage baseplate assembly protein W
MAILDRRQNQFIEDKDTRVSVGIKLPFGRQPGSGKGYFATTDNTIDAIKEDIKLLLRTQRGERLFQPTLGMDIRRFLFEQITENTVIEIENDIVDTFERWLPFVNLSDITVDISDQDRNKIKINIEFNIENAPTELESVGVVLE